MRSMRTDLFLSLTQHTHTQHTYISMLLLNQRILEYNRSQTFAVCVCVSQVDMWIATVLARVCIS